MTTDYSNLEKNIRLIESEFRTFNPSDASLPENQRKLRACISLMHSEFEAYFEITASKVFEKYNNKSMNRVQEGQFTYAISLYSFKSYDGQSESKNQRVQASLISYKNGITQNNGIKEKDILKLLLPIGLNLTSLDTTWLTCMNSFGSLRGELMHKNINQITRLIGYKYIDETIYNILIPGTKKIDQFLIATYGIK